MGRGPVGRTALRRAVGHAIAANVARGRSLDIHGYLLDALDGLERIRVAVAYELDGRRTELAPDTRNFDRARPIYEEFPGWMSPTEGISDLDDLPPNARSYVEAISQITGIPLGLIGTGRHRDAAIILRDPFAAT